jgi:mannosidase alpha-like ER degradation enhancer 3
MFVGKIFLFNQTFKDISSNQLFRKCIVSLRNKTNISEKARLAQSAGAHGAIVIDNNEGTTSANSPLFAMSGDGTDDVN